MNLKKFIITFLIFMLGFGKTSNAQQIPTATTLKEGIYHISSEHFGHYRNIKLLTSDKPVTITILNSTGAQTFFIKLTDKNEVLKIGPIKDAETIIISGEGEISISH